MITRIELGIQTESITGYYVYIQYENRLVYESRCGVGKGCFPVHEEPYEATVKEWYEIIIRNQSYIENMKKKYPNSRFSIHFEGYEV